MFDRLSETKLRQLPNLTEARNKDAVRLMVRLGWPIAVSGGGWKASPPKPPAFQRGGYPGRFLPGERRRSKGGRRVSRKGPGAPFGAFPQSNPPDRYGRI